MLFFSFLTLACYTYENKLDIDNDNDGATTYEGDCDDNVASITVETCTDNDEDGYAEVDGDCDDTNPDAFPTNQELCSDEFDNNCDGNINEDDAVDAISWYSDEDDDGYGNPNTMQTSCVQPIGNVENGEDCDDNYPHINPRGEEICDELNQDEDCDGLVNEEDDSLDDSTMSNWYLDEDGDGYGLTDDVLFLCSQQEGRVQLDNDCDDSNPDVRPNAIEVCDEIDNDCDGFTDDADDNLDIETGVPFYRDFDSDGFGNPDIPQLACSAQNGFVDNSDDCNDSQNTIHPNADEICDNVDNDCDSLIDDDDDDTLESSMSSWFMDADDDGTGTDLDVILACETSEQRVTNSDDCDDTNEFVSIQAIEICDEIDNDCDLLVDDDDPDRDVSTAQRYYLDLDSDGYGIDGLSFLLCNSDTMVTNADDCNDTDPNSTSTTEDVDCDGIPDACDFGFCDLHLELGNGIGMDFVLIEGDDLVDPGTGNGSRYSLQNAFYMMTTEVTQGMFSELMGYDSRDGEATTYGDGANFPAYYVSWNMAAHFANTLGIAQGEQECYTCSGSGTSVTCSEAMDPNVCTGFSLPTEHEWELSSRSGTTSEFWTGSGPALGGMYSANTCDAPVTIDDGVNNPLLEVYSWFFCNTYNSSEEVATLFPNGFGLYDMHGNLWEWNADWYGCVFPNNGAWCSTVSSERILRGGGRGSYPEGLANAGWSSETTAYRSKFFGFRLRKIATP